MSLIRIAHLSDPHFGTIRPGVQEGLLATLQELKPDLILLTGDITQRARRKQFRDAKYFTRLIKPTPLIAVPGNHDIPLFNIFARLFNPYRGYRKLFKDQLEKDYEQGDIVVTGLNSTSRWRHIQGDFNFPRIERRLKEKKSKAKVHIVTFHHPMDCRKPSDEKNLLIGRDQAIDIFDRHNVDLIIGGHIHDPYVTLSKVRYPNTKRTMVLGVAGTCLSWRTRPGAPNSFNFIEVDTHGVPLISIARYDQTQNLKFSVVHKHHFQRPDDNGWVVI